MLLSFLVGNQIVAQAEVQKSRQTSGKLGEVHARCVNRMSAGYPFCPNPCPTDGSFSSLTLPLDSSISTGMALTTRPIHMLVLDTAAV
jgi:hypothetical protein